MAFTPVSSLAPASVAIIGAVAVTQSTSPWVVGDGGGSLTVDGSFLTDAQLRAVAVPVSAAALPLPAGAARDVTLTDGTQRVGGTVVVDGSAVTQPVSGPLTDAQLRATPVPVSGTVAVTGALTDAELRASAVPVSVATLPLPDGAASEATLTAVGDTLGTLAMTEEASNLALALIAAAVADADPDDLIAGDADAS